jgi:hypothetical protein
MVRRTRNLNNSLFCIKAWSKKDLDFCPWQCQSKVKILSNQNSAAGYALSLSLPNIRKHYKQKKSNSRRTTHLRKVVGWTQTWQVYAVSYTGLPNPKGKSTLGIGTSTVILGTEPQPDLHERSTQKLEANQVNQTHVASQSIHKKDKIIKIKPADRENCTHPPPYLPDPEWCDDPPP